MLTSSGTTDTLTILSPFDPAPIAGAIWQLLSDNLAPRRFAVISNEPGETGYTITARLHDPNKQARVEGGVVLSLPSITAYPTGVIAVPTGLTHGERIEQLASGTWRHVVTLGWNSHPDPRVTRFEVQYRQTDAAAWTDGGLATGVTAEIDELGGGDYQFRIRAISFVGQYSPWTEPYGAALIGLNDVPPDVADFAISVLGPNASFSWTPLAIANLDHYEIRFAANPSVLLWQSMVPIAQAIVGTSIQLPARSGVYAIKAVTAQGQESANPALVISNVDGITVNVVETLAGDPDWDGRMQGVVYDRARRAIRLADAGRLGDYPNLGAFPDGNLFSRILVPNGTFSARPILDLGEVFEAHISADLSVFSENIRDDLWSKPDIWGPTDIWGSDFGGWDAWIEISTTEDDPNGSPTWSDWRRLTVSTVRLRALRWRYQLKTTDLSVTPIAKGSVIVDMPDSIRTGAHIPVPLAGQRIAFDPAFHGPARPSLVITGIEGAQPGDWCAVSMVDRTGFFAQVWNAGALVAGRTIDYQAKGYGSVAQ